MNLYAPRNTGLESVEVIINTFDQVSNSQIGNGINLYSISDKGVSLLPYTTLPNGQGFELKINSKDTPLFRAIQDKSELGNYQPPTAEELRNPKYNFYVDPGSYLYVKTIALPDGSFDTILRYKWPVKTYSINTLPLARRDQINQMAINVPMSNVQVPQTFDSRQKWSGPNFTAITNALNQLDCGSCWAFATTTCLSDRYRIRNINNRTSPKVAEMFASFPYRPSSQIVYQSLNNVSPYQLARCDTNGNEQGCGGGVIASALQFLVNNGANSLISIGVRPLETQGQLSACTRDTSLNIYKGVALGKISEMNSSSASNEQKMQAITKIKQEIYSHGPVCAGFTVYNDFYNFKSGVYNGGSGGIAGGHAVVIIGWGDGYWIVRNSWGLDWGIVGHFNISFAWTPPNATDSNGNQTLGILDEVWTLAVGA